MVGISFRGLVFTDSFDIMSHLYFVVFKNKKDNDYKLFANEIFDSEKKANDFGKKSMKRGFEHKVLEYTRTNVDRYWYDEKR
jgi:hypothetical protein